MRILGTILILAAATASCIEPLDECAQCYSIQKDIYSGEIISKDSEGEMCGSDLDSLEGQQPIYLDQYSYYYECE